MTVRCKFRCNKKTELDHGGAKDNGFAVEFSAVADGSEENKQFFKWTPSATLKLETINPSAAAAFEVGKSYYVDLSPAQD